MYVQNNSNYSFTHLNDVADEIGSIWDEYNDLKLFYNKHINQFNEWYTPKDLKQPLLEYLKLIDFCRNKDDNQIISLIFSNIITYNDSESMKCLIIIDNVFSSDDYYKELFNNIFKKIFMNMFLNNRCEQVNQKHLRYFNKIDSIELLHNLPQDKVRYFDELESTGLNLNEYFTSFNFDWVTQVEGSRISLKHRMITEAGKDFLETFLNNTI
jgi:hypothetical protein